jgi:hypothetical protein
MAEIDSRLPWRDEFEFCSTDSLELAAQEFARKSVANGLVRQDKQNDLVVALVRSGLYYRLGLTVNKAITSNKASSEAWRRSGDNAAADLLKLPARSRPKIYAFQGLIWVMADAWEFFGLEPKPPAYDPSKRADRDSQFSRVCKDWIQILREIDSPLDGLLRKPVRRALPLPTRSVFRRVLDQRRKASGT